NKNIDSQTSMILDLALDQQIERRVSDIAQTEDRRIEIKMGEEEKQTYLARAMRADNTGLRVVYRPEQKEITGSVILNDTTAVLKSGNTQFSIPKGGWKVLDEYIVASLQAKRISGGYTSYQFRLDSNGIPY